MENSIESMPMRVAAVLKAKGGYNIDPPPRHKGGLV